MQAITANLFVTYLCVCTTKSTLILLVLEKMLFMFLHVRRDSGGIPGAGQGWEWFHLKTGAGRGHALTRLYA